MKQYNGEKYIVSFTSFGQRFDAAAKMVFNLLSRQTYKNIHIVMTVYKDDIANITENMRLLIDNDLIELIVADENLCPHLKYFYAMKKYKDKPIITVDDDRLTHPRLLEMLINKYESINYKSVISVSAPIMTKTGNKVNARTAWSRPENRLKPNASSYLAVAEGFAGVLYPANCFDDIDKYLNIIKLCLYDDDICLKAMEIMEHMPVTQINGTESHVPGANIAGTQEVRLAVRTAGNMQYRNNITVNLSKFLLCGWTL